MAPPFETLLADLEPGSFAQQLFGAEIQLNYAFHIPTHIAGEKKREKKNRLAPCKAGSMAHVHHEIALAVIKKKQLAIRHTQLPLHGCNGASIVSNESKKRQDIRQQKASIIFHLTCLATKIQLKRVINKERFLRGSKPPRLRCTADRT